MIVELDLSGVSFSKQFKKANKLKSKSIVVIGDDEAANGEFIIRLFDQPDNGNEEEVISFENDIKLENWVKNNLLKQDSLNYMDKRKILLDEIRNEYKKISRENSEGNIKKK